MEELRPGGRDHRLRRGRHARLPRLGHARQRGQRQPPLLRPGAARRGGRPAGRVIRGARGPRSIVTYGDDQRGYPHPDHLRVHDITVPAVDAAGDPDGYPEAGEPWQVVEALLLGLVAGAHRGHPREVPRARPRVAVRRGVVRAPVARTTASPPRSTSTGFADVRRDALLAHATQIDPDVAVLVRPAPRGRRATIHPYDDYILARSRGRRADARGRPLRRPPCRGQRLGGGAAPYLSQEWLDRQRELVGAPARAAGRHGRLQHVVTGAPGR